MFIVQMPACFTDDHNEKCENVKRLKDLQICANILEIILVFWGVGHTAKRSAIIQNLILAGSIWGSGD